VSTLLSIKKSLALFTLLAFLAASAGGFTAAPPAHAAAINLETLSASAASALADSIFRVLDIPATSYEIGDLNTTRHLGKGEIALAYSLAKSSGYPVSRIVQMRHDQKMGWGKIAKTLGVKLRGAADKSDNILRDGKFDKDADELKVKIGVDIEEEDKPGKADNDDDKPGKNNKDGKPGKTTGKNK